MARRLPPHPLLPLRAIRLRDGRSMERLAVAASVTAQTIYLLETRPEKYRGVSVYTLTRLATALGVTILDLCPWFARPGAFPPDPAGDPTPVAGNP